MYGIISLLGELIRKNIDLWMALPVHIERMNDNEIQRLETGD